MVGHTASNDSHSNRHIDSLNATDTQILLTIETVQMRDFIYLGIRLEIRLCSIQLPCFWWHFIGAPCDGRGGEWKVETTR
jgi:hypothetical protein